jgi:hypothetical protein
VLAGPRCVVVISQHEDEGNVWALLERGVAGYGSLHKVAWAMWISS